ncbi:hydrogenase [bacterium]|nr:hydrogenase [bacterium]
MKITADQIKNIAKHDLRHELKQRLKNKDNRLGLVTSIDGEQVLTLVLDCADKTAELWQSDLEGASEYPAVSPVVPQAHWFERRLKDLFHIEPTGHPRLKSTFTENAFDGNLAPLALDQNKKAPGPRDFSYLKVEGKGVYELPVGPVHAGIIEPGHFRLSCQGEVIQNLELKLGYLHRGVEKRLTEIPWKLSRHLCEQAASDTAAANALANAIALEALLEIEISETARRARTIALEIERLAMHIADVGGMAVDLGIAAEASTLSRLRGQALRMAELLSGSRFLKGFICPGGINVNSDFAGERTRIALKSLHAELSPALYEVLHTFTDNTYVQERLENTGKIPHSLAEEFGLVGPAARASGIAYDTRTTFNQGLYKDILLEPALEKSGDALARTLVRVKEIETSITILEKLLEESLDEAASAVALPESLKANSFGVAIVEAFRGELIHLIATDSDGAIVRYVIKDPSLNNWTAMAIAVRNELIADFPVCNKSFSLSYSGHDL